MEDIGCTHEYRRVEPIESAVNEDPADRRSRHMLYMCAVLMVSIFVASVAVKPVREPLFTGLLNAGQVMQHNGVLGQLFYISLYVGWVTVCLPQTCVEALAGFIFSLPVAILLAAIARGAATITMCTIGPLVPDTTCACLKIHRLYARVVCCFGWHPLFRY